MENHPEASVPPKRGERPLPPDWRPEFVRSVSSARAWAILLGVTLVLVGVAILLSGAGLTAFAGEMGLAEGLVRVLGGIYLVLGPVIAIPSLFLFRYAGAARRYADEKIPVHLEAAMRAHARFWSYVGIVTLVGLVIEVSVLMMALVGGKS